MVIWTWPDGPPAIVRSSLVAGGSGKSPSCVWSTVLRPSLIDRSNRYGGFAVASAKSGTSFSEAIYTGQGLTVAAIGRQFSSANDKPLHNQSDRIEKESPEKGLIPPLRRKARRSAK